jgi:hypothetical protein
MGQQNILYRVKANTDETCAWCGARKLRMFRYGVTPGQARQDATFCNVECYMTFFNVRRADFDYVHTVHEE